MFKISGEIQLFIDNEEYDFESKFDFYFHPTNFSYMKFLNVIKKDVNFYPENMKVQKIEREFTFAEVKQNGITIFFGIINKTGRFSLLPNKLKTKAIEIADFRKWLSLSKNIDKVFFNKKPTEIISEVLNVLNEPRFKIGVMNFSNNDFIKAYSLHNKNAYQILKDVIPNLTNSILVFKIEGDFITINYKSNQEIKDNVSPIILDFQNQLFFSDYKILDINYENDTSNYLNSISCTSDNLLSEKPVDNEIKILENETLTLSNNISKIINEKDFTFISLSDGEKITLEIKNEKNIDQNEYYDLLFDAGKNTLKINKKYLNINAILFVRFFSKISLTITANNYSEIKKISQISKTSGIVSSVEKYNDVSNINDLYRILNSRLEKKSIEKISLTITSNEKIWNLLDIVSVKNYSPDIDGNFLVHEISGSGSSWKNDELITYSYLLKKTLSTDNIVNLFDSQSFRDNPVIESDAIFETTETIGKELILIWNTESSKIESSDSFYQKNLLQKNLQANLTDSKFDVLEITDD